MSSNASTPDLGPQPSQLTFPSPSPLGAHPSPTASSPDDNNDDIPDLTLGVLTTKADKAAALRIIADSIAQQRQRAVRHVFFHPLPFTLLLGLLTAVYRFAWARDKRHDLGTALLLASGAVMAYLHAIRYLASGYLRAAEALSWDFLSGGEEGEGDGGVEDLVVGTKFGDKLVGALVLRLERPGQSSSSSSSSLPSPPSAANGNSIGNGNISRRKSHHRRNSSLNAARSAWKGGQGLIRAWTTRLQYRGRGVGGDMLREAVRLTRERCGRDARVGFAARHAHSAAVLPEFFNAGFVRKDERRAVAALEKILEEWDGGRRR